MLQKCACLLIHIHITSLDMSHNRPIRVAVFVIDIFLSKRSKVIQQQFDSEFFVEDGKKSNIQSSRIITKRENVDDENSHSNRLIILF